MHIAAPSCPDHTFRFSHGIKKVKKPRAGRPPGRPPKPRSASAANSTPAAANPGPRQQAGASSAWDAQRFGANPRRHMSGEERGSSGEDDDDDDDDDDSDDDNSDSDQGRR